LAELGILTGGDGDGDGVEDVEEVEDGEYFESLEELEKRLMRELAAMPDAEAMDEAALMASINDAEDGPDEADVLLAQLLGMA
jgi:hypothetical protein